MRKFSHIVIAKQEQKSPRERQVILDFIAQWNKEKDKPFRDAEDLGIVWDIYLSDIDTNPIFFELKQALEVLADTEGIIYHCVILVDYDEVDYDEADFIRISGTALYNQKTPFFLNEETATRYKVCPKCQDEEYGGYFEQVEPFKLDESLITIQLAHTPKDPSDTWDIIGLQGGHLIVSAKCRTFLEQQEAKGYSLHPVYNIKGEISTKLFQIKVDKVILTPHYQTPETTAFYCTGCGLMLSRENQNTFYLDPKEIEELDFFSKNPNKSSSIYISNKLYKKFKAAKINGILYDSILNFY